MEISILVEHEQIGQPFSMKQDILLLKLKLQTIDSELQNYFGFDGVAV